MIFLFICNTVISENSRDFFNLCIRFPYRNILPGCIEILNEYIVTEEDH